MRPALILAGLGLAAAILLAGLDQLTRERIADERKQRALSAVSAMLSGIEYDNDLLEDTTSLSVPELADPVTIYRARLRSQPVAAVMDVVTPAGYSGDIRLLVAADIEGTVLGVRILEHRETPGLGDKIERGKSDWVEQFEDTSLENPPAKDWAPDRRDGAFDTVTSATITSAAVIDAVKRVLRAFESSKRNLFETAENKEDTD
ncbi:RnfABCDGE type electron transport complex subunit G [Wenzhouxiangella sp. EGI_FJ10305]|uniref:RnfABCDGE type electron transport complex subunit G n=1 Tax=Wenzhouxiangella sp. EGI_FJ10305 TaxID=3243768 RepID=UPI0035DDC830